MELKHCECIRCKQISTVYAYTSHQIRMFYLCISCMSVVLQKSFIVFDHNEIQELLENSPLSDVDPYIQTK